MDDWSTPYPIQSLYRSDLLRVSLTQEQAASFSDEDMRKLALKMSIKYLGSEVFWTHLLAAVEQVLQEKEQQHAITHTDEQTTGKEETA